MFFVVEIKDLVRFKGILAEEILIKMSKEEMMDRIIEGTLPLNVGNILRNIKDYPEAFVRALSVDIISISSESELNGKISSLEHDNRVMKERLGTS